MKRVSWAIMMTLLGGCTVGTPVAEEKKPDSGTQTLTEAEFANTIPGFCNDSCMRFDACPGVDVATDCLAECVSYMSAFLSHGDGCVALGVEFEGCANTVRTCDDYANPPACMQDTGPHDLCAGRSEPPPDPTTCLGCDPTCDVSGGGTGPATPGAPSVTASCQLDGENCSDGSFYQLRCSAVQGALMCSCFKNGDVSGTFESTTGCPPSVGEQFSACGWALPLY